MSYFKHFFSQIGRREYGKLDDPNVPKIINEIDNRTGFKTAHNRAQYLRDMDKKTNQTGNAVGCIFGFLVILGLVTFIFWTAS